MKQKLRLSNIHQIATSLQQTHSLNPRTRWYPTLNESNRMKSAYFTIHLGKNPPPQNSCELKSFFHFLFFQKQRFHIFHFPNSTILFTKPTGRHFTKYRFSPNIVVTTWIISAFMLVIYAFNGFKFIFSLYMWPHTPHTKGKVGYVLKLDKTWWRWLYTKIATALYSSRCFQVQPICKFMRGSTCTYHTLQALSKS